MADKRAAYNYRTELSFTTFSCDNYLFQIFILLQTLYTLQLNIM